MSSLFRNSGVRLALGATAAAAAAASGPAAIAADIFYQPVVSLATAYNSNVLLDPGVRQSAEGYYADAAENIGIATPNSETTLQPRLLYNYYPSESDLDRLEGFLSLASRYSWQRDRFQLSGYFDHRDDVNAEQPGAELDPVTPTIGATTGTTGHIVTGLTRNFLELDPSFSHYLTPLSSIGVSADYQRMSYSPPDTSEHVDFNYYLGRVFYGWTPTLRTDMSVAAFGSRYVAGNIDSTSTSGGISGDLNYSWSQTLKSDISVLVQQTRLNETDPRVFDDTSHPWGGNFSTVYKGQLSTYSFSVGRILTPSGAGGLFSTDQVRGQYDRFLTQRLQFTGAIRYFRDRTVEGVIDDDTRYYLTSLVKLQYMLTQKIFIAGAYTYVWQKYRADPSGADANVVSFTIGYKGLDRQR